MFSPKDEAGRPKVLAPEVVASEEGTRRWSCPRRRKQRHVRFGKKVSLKPITKTHPSIYSLRLGYHPQAGPIGQDEGRSFASCESRDGMVRQEQEKYGRARENSPTLALRPHSGAVTPWTRLHCHGRRLPRPRASVRGRDHGPAPVLLRPARVVGGGED